ncbi:hypothetical protein CVO77_00260 [Sphingopyxis lindanitolerans]|uniref:Peptidase n=1 Tax=Sphingopyxis lindanitolerans TaxID=2054227 RepID=A0A2S8BAM5_9SPHN|nr:hypothetical protein [Sphingopyxis lindanitolerans]PQM29407.1 hypothetical protein CVO77_00260 [Sphingopyxis lindanitolerans]
MTTETDPNDATTDAAETAAATAMGDAAAAETNAGTTDAVKTDEVKVEPTPEEKAVADAEAAKTAAESIIGAPEAYDAAAFTMPEGVEFDAEMFDLVKDDLKGMDLSQKGAEKVVGLFAEKVAPAIAARATKAIDDAGAQLRANLARDLQADPEIGGAKLKESQAFAAKAIAHFIPDAPTRSEFSKFLNESGLGDHPLLARVIAGAGRAISEASTPLGGGGNAELTASEKFYGRKG